MYGGIDQLVDTYKGNPQPLAQKVQQAQQGQPPGAIPPDLEAALALQEITQLRQGAQNQQAMQAGGAQPTVVQKLQQMLGGMQQQAQMPQAQPVMAARGGSIDQLMSNLGRHYAGGGIIAFDDGGRGEDKKPLEQYTLQQQGADWVARKQAARLAEAEGQNKESLPQFIQDIAKFPELFDAWKQRAREQDAINAAADRRMAQYKQDKLAAQQKTSLANYLIGSPEREKEGLEKLAELSNAPLPKTSVGDLPAPTKAKGPATVATPLSDIRGQLNAADAARFAEKPAPKPPAAPAAPRPPTANVNAPAKPATPATTAVDPTSLRALSEKYIREEMGLSPETESDKAVARARKLMGLDELLKEKEGRASAKEKYINEMKAKRAPLWIDALMSAGKPTKGGIAGVLQNMAVGAISGKQNYEAEDLKYIDELNRLRDVITDAKITGNKELAKEALAAFKETDARRKAALTSATSLLNTDATTEASNQRAREAAAGRAQVAAIQAEGKKSERQQRQQNWIAEQERKWQDTLNKSPAYKTLIEQRAMYERLLNTSTNPTTQEKAQASVNAINEQIAKMLPTAMGGAANIPPPPPGAVRETVKKS